VFPWLSLMVSRLDPVCRSLGRRYLERVIWTAPKHLRRGASQLGTSSQSRWTRQISTTRPASSERQVAVAISQQNLAGVPDQVVPGPKPLSLSVQRTAARLAETLNILEGEVGGDKEWSQRVEAALVELQSSTGRKGRLAGKTISSSALLLPSYR
jgi:hypothetical protein